MLCDNYLRIKTSHSKSATTFHVKSCAKVRKITRLADFSLNKPKNIVLLTVDISYSLFKELDI